MSKISIDDMQAIIHDLIIELIDSEDGAQVTTARLLEDAGYGYRGFDEADIAEIDSVIRKAAPESKLVLEDAGGAEFVVRNADAQIVCPSCGSKNTARLIYGMPVFNEALRRKIEAGKVVFGGCEIETTDEFGSTVWLAPERRCSDCGKVF